MTPAERWASLPTRLFEAHPRLVVAAFRIAGAVFFAIALPVDNHPASLVDAIFILAGVIVAGAAYGCVLAFGVALAYCAVLLVGALVWFVASEVLRALRQD